MENTPPITQSPPPGSHLRRYRGDTQLITFQLSHPRDGQGWLRTTIGQAAASRREIIDAVLDRAPALGRDWFDVPMQPLDDRTWQVRLPLTQVGWFDAKSYFLENGQTDPLWPAGPNLRIRVEPADTVGANIIYNAFVRQFGPSKTARQTLPQTDARILGLDLEHYTVIPPSGTFRDLIPELDFIVSELGCRIIQLLPIHPTPTTYARMGRFGSPYAALNFTAIDPALAQFDPRATPLEQFTELVDAIHARQAKLFLDMAINHTGWAAALHETHPHWLARKPDGQIECPGAWGVTWEDLTKLDYTHIDLWQYMADIFLTWCRRGVDGFRCDAGYMIPLAAWQFMIARVREQYPDTIFFLEGLGGRVSVTQALLDTAGFNWAYSELFQNYQRHEIEHYLPQALDLEQQAGTLVHFAETHDNQRLAARNHAYAGLRTALCALFSQNGAFGFANGVEWLATEKINVHEVTGLNWGAEVNQVALLKRLHTLLHTHPAFFESCHLNLITAGDGERVVLERTYETRAGQPQSVWVVANLDDALPIQASWPKPDSWPAGTVYDLVSEQVIQLEVDHQWCRMSLAPGQVACLTHTLSTPEDDAPRDPGFTLPGRSEWQRKKAQVLELMVHFRGLGDIGNIDLITAAAALCDNPLEFVRRLNPDSEEPLAVTWQWPHDQRRQVMIPAGHVLLIQSPQPFEARLTRRERCHAQVQGLPLRDQGWFAILIPPPAGNLHRAATLTLTVFEPGTPQHGQAPLLQLASTFPRPKAYRWRTPHLADGQQSVLDTDGNGTVMRANAKWGHLNSRYDALLAINPSPDSPDDRLVQLVRCRVWAAYQGYSHAVGNTCLDMFSAQEGVPGRWRFKIPTGQGRWIEVTMSLGLRRTTRPELQIQIERHPADDRPGALEDDREVRFVIRPDLEQRNFHHTTKAYTGPEQQFPQATRNLENGFVFAPPQSPEMHMFADQGKFVPEPEWQYMVPYPQDADRGLDAHTDLFSPGYFEFQLAGQRRQTLSARVDKALPTPTAPPPLVFDSHPTDAPTAWLSQLASNLNHYLTRRNGLATVIAGYPWFLDWGRDALIFARGLIAAGQTETVIQILTLFGQFEQKGMLPNMIQGKTPANWDTSDAPLWFVMVCRDLCQADPRNTAQILDRPCGDRSVRDILISIARHYRQGTPNGIRMDAQSGLIFSPAHFTWMDTNHPAGTPRQGYAIEIQALWFAALQFLAQVDPQAQESGWAALARQVQQSMGDLFYQPHLGFLSDCLHAQPGQTARQAQPDDALRPNQLLALTLGAVTDLTLGREVLAACETLLIPGAIRSLADRPLKTGLAIHHQGQSLNDPHHPYQGHYTGDEDTRRKPAYHNGTAWTWPFPHYAEAWVKIYGPHAKTTSLAWLSSSTRLLDAGCAGHLPEILDGDAPHLQRGCDAQAWGLSELLRVLSWLSVADPTQTPPLGKSVHRH